MNLHGVSHFFIFYGYNYLLMWTWTGAGFFVGSIASNKEVALSYITIKLNNINILIKLLLIIQKYCFIIIELTQYNREL